MEVTQRLKSIRQALLAKRDSKALAAFQKSIPTSRHVYGVRVPVLNQLAKEHREGGLELAEALWVAGAFEERLLAAKLLGLSARKNPEEALSLAKRFTSDISDWAVCDTLGMQGLRGVAVKKKGELFAWSKKLAASKNPWERRLALVVLTHYIKDRPSRIQIEQTVSRLSGDKEYYVRKAVAWLGRDLQK